MGQRRMKPMAVVALLLAVAASSTASPQVSTQKPAVSHDAGDEAKFIVKFEVAFTMADRAARAAPPAKQMDVFLKNFMQTTIEMANKRDAGKPLQRYTELEKLDDAMQRARNATLDASVRPEDRYKAFYGSFIASLLPLAEDDVVTAGSAAGDEQQFLDKLAAGFQKADAAARRAPPANQMVVFADTFDQETGFDVADYKPAAAGFRKFPNILDAMKEAMGAAAASATPAERYPVFYAKFAKALLSMTKDDVVATHTHTHKGGAAARKPAGAGADDDAYVNKLQAAFWKADKAARAAPPDKQMEAFVATFDEKIGFDITDTSKACQGCKKLPKILDALKHAIGSASNAAVPANRYPTFFTEFTKTLPSVPRVDKVAAAPASV